MSKESEKSVPMYDGKVFGIEVSLKEREKMNGFEFAQLFGVLERIANSLEKIQKDITEIKVCGLEVRREDK